MAFLGQFLQALIAIPKIGAMIEKAIQAIVLWYVQSQTNETLSEISDAAAYASRAQTDDDRYKAAEMWQKALSRPRISA